MIRWFANNSIAANFLMIAILVSGIFTAIYRLPLEVSPSLSWQTVMIVMPYRGGTAKDVEKAILIPVEEALEGLPGIRQINSDGSRGMATFYLDAEPGVDLRELQEEVKARIDTITTFPTETERPRVFIPKSGNFQPVLSVAVTGDLNDVEMRRLARRVQDDLQELPGISRTVLEGGRRFEISIEPDPHKLTAYRLSFQDLADAIRRFSIDLPAGAIDSLGGTFIVRTRGQAYSESDFGRIPIRSSQGAEVALGEVATIHDDFEEGDKRIRFNGKRALFVQVLRTGRESAIDISNKVRDYVRTASQRFPAGIDLYVWSDDSLTIRGRLGTLAWSMVQGCVLVFVVLGLFLRPMMAFWIVCGIPVSFAGAALVMPSLGITANVMSLFGLILVLGIVVDDAIVTGESVYSKLCQGVPPLEASIAGTEEVAIPVTYGCLTTVVAFVPMYFFDGKWGDFAKQIPPVAIAVLLFSLMESKLCLPSHLKHIRRDAGGGWFPRFQAGIARSLEWFVEKIFQPTLNVALSFRWTVVAIFAGMAMLMTAYCISGRMKFVAFPAIDTMRITAIIDLPNNTALETTDRYVQRIAGALEILKREFTDPGTGQSMIRNVSVVTGGFGPGAAFDKSAGFVSVEILDPKERTVPGPRNQEIANRWTELVRPIPEATAFRIFSDQSLDKGQEYADENLHVELRGPTSPKKAEIAERAKSLMQGYAGITTAWAYVNYGQDELEFSLKPRAAELGVTQVLLAQQIRQAFFGEEAQRVQRGIDDIRVMVRLPKIERESLYTLETMRIRTPRGVDVPLATVAEVRFVKAPSFVERNDRAEVIRMGAQPADETIDLMAMAESMSAGLRALCSEGENLSFEFKGMVAKAAQARWQTIVMSAGVALAIYGLLAVPLKSLLQPLIVMLAIPFSILGALVGHLLMGIVPSYLSVFGMLALAGVSVNDSLVLVDYVNQRRRDGVSTTQAARKAGGRRFRPIWLTSATTFAGLVPTDV
jgi:multidrug efflux pump subunit AcrB